MNKLWGWPMFYMLVSYNNSLFLNTMWLLLVEGLCYGEWVYTVSQGSVQPHSERISLRNHTTSHGRGMRERSCWASLKKIEAFLFREAFCHISLLGAHIFPVYLSNVSSLFWKGNSPSEIRRLFCFSRRNWEWKNEKLRWITSYLTMMDPRHRSTPHLDQARVGRKGVSARGRSWQPRKWCCSW